MMPFQVYDGTFDLIATPDNPGCDFPAYEGEVGADGAGRIALAGGPGTYFAGADKGLLIQNRANPWDSIDVTLGGLDDGQYRMVVEFGANDETEFHIADADGPWAWHTSASGTEVTLAHTFDVEGGMYGAQNRLRLNAAEGASYYVKSIKIFKGPGLADGQVYDGTLDLVTMPFNPGNDYPAYEDVVGENGSGWIALAGGPITFFGNPDAGLLIQNRENAWDSIDLTFGGLDDGAYLLEVVFTANDAIEFHLAEADGPWGWFTSDSGTEVTLTHEFSVSDGLSDGQNRIRLNADAGSSYYVKSIKIFAR
jgi:hypothetical protein